MAVELTKFQYQAAIKDLQNGSILCGGVGSGKSRTALSYYMKDCKGKIKIVVDGEIDDVYSDFREMIEPRDLYIITTAKKRDGLEWEKECGMFNIFPDVEISHSGIKMTVDSWNNIKKYKDVIGAFFIFDEQRLVGRGAWVKTFLDIARKNRWVLLSATPGDQWSDYIPVFVANGFYKNRTDFSRQHIIYSRFSKYPKIERYVGERILKQYLETILVRMPDTKKTERHYITKFAEYDKELFKIVFKQRWDPYEDCPIEESGKWVYLMRRVVNSDESRLKIIKEIIDESGRVIIFYNHSYELDILRDFCGDIGIHHAEWNGERHEELPNNKKWVYLVQYSAGCEGWNCTTTDTMIFYSQNYSYRVREQASGRIDRMNTPFYDLYYYDIRSHAFIDNAIYERIRTKKRFNEQTIKNLF